MAPDAGEASTEPNDAYNEGATDVADANVATGDDGENGYIDKAEECTLDSSKEVEEEDDVEAESKSSPSRFRC
jgi:hypothetical protein